MLLRQKDKHRQSLSDWSICTGLGTFSFFQRKEKYYNKVLKRWKQLKAPTLYISVRQTNNEQKENN